MKPFLLLCSLVLSLLALPARADEPASEASIRQLLEVSQSKKILDSTLAQMDGMLRSAMKQATAGQPLNPAQEAVMADMSAKLVALFRQELDWATLESTYVDIYRRSFSQREVDGMLAFYRSEVGQAVIAKMPLVMQNSMQLMQDRTLAMMPKIQKLAAESAERMRQAAK